MEVQCVRCESVFEKSHCEIKRSPNHFCSRSCAASFNNTKCPKRRPVSGNKCCPRETTTNKCCLCDVTISSRRKYCDSCLTDSTRQCGHCQVEISGCRRKFCSTKCKNNFYQNNCYDKQQVRGNERKKVLIELSGGGCASCGYNKNTAALSFHHIDPKTKSFGLDLRHLSNRCMSAIMEEFAKCTLLCVNCHFELHHPDCDTRR